jgi:hypothetical protein
LLRFWRREESKFAKKSSAVPQREPARAKALTEGNEENEARRTGGEAIMAIPEGDQRE